MIIIAAIGLLCAKLGLVDDATNKRLSALLMLVVNPIVIFLSYQRPFDERLLNNLLLSIFLGLVSFTITVVVSHIVYRNRGDKDKAVERFAAIYPNAGFLGIPLIYGIFGSEGVLYLTGYLTVFFGFMWTHGMIVMSGKRDPTAIKKAVLSPALIAIFAGFAMFMLRIQIPEIIRTPLEIVGNMNTPMAMLVAGASIYGTNIGKMLKDKRIYGLCVMRLLILPILTILALMPFDIPHMVRATIVVAAACPVAINLILFAHRHGRDYVFASQAFALATVLSMGTIPLLLMFL